MRRLIVNWADVVVCLCDNILHSLPRWKDADLDLFFNESAKKERYIAADQQAQDTSFIPLGYHLPICPTAL